MIEAVVIIMLIMIESSDDKCCCCLFLDGAAYSCIVVRDWLDLIDRLRICVVHFCRTYFQLPSGQILVTIIVKYCSIFEPI